MIREPLAIELLVPPHQRISERSEIEAHNDAEFHGMEGPILTSGRASTDSERGESLPRPFEFEKPSPESLQP
jgi:hypothetical protein